METSSKPTNSYEPDDETLIEEFKNGNRESFNILVKRYQKRAVNYLYRISRDFELAEDIAQMGFLTVFEKASLFNAGYKFRPWFYKILTNLYYYELRKKKIGPQYIIEISDKNIDYRAGNHRKIMTGEAKSTLEVLEQKEKRAELEKLISSLPNKQRTALILYIYNELSYKEIAITLGCSVGTVKSRIHYALRNLKGNAAQLRSEGKI